MFGIFVWIGFVGDLFALVTERTALGSTNRYPVSSFFRDPLLFTLDVPHRVQKKALMDSQWLARLWWQVMEFVLKPLLKSTVFLHTSLSKLSYSREYQFSRVNTVYPKTTLFSDKVIHSITHNIYIIINTQLATCFGSSEPSSGQFLTHCGRVTQICVFNTVKLGTSASSP